MRFEIYRITKKENASKKVGTVAVPDDEKNDFYAWLKKKNFFYL